MNKQEIDRICKYHHITNYTINEDGSIDVVGEVNLSERHLSEIPLKFRRVKGDFWIHENKLLSLKNAPDYIEGGFYCYKNKLTTLEYLPKYVSGQINCCNNNLISLKGISEKLLCNFFMCSGNKIKNINYFPKHFISNLCLSNNPIDMVLELFTDHSIINSLICSQKNKDLLLDFRYREIIQEDILILDRLVEFLEDTDKPQTKEYLFNLLKDDYEIK